MMHTPRVLVVDDDPDTVETQVAILATAGFYVAAAAGGRKAIAAAEADPPDVALVDLAMPGVDGFEVARRLRARTGRPTSWRSRVRRTPGTRRGGWRPGSPST
jgi:two-component system OmpR family response regulator